jgi:hypothetical protein
MKQFLKAFAAFLLSPFSVFVGFKVSYLPPAMVYCAAGVSGLTAIVGTFFVKDYLGLSAAFLASLGFWAGIPWALKMPLGYLVDLFSKWKGLLVFLGAALIAASIAIMVALLEDPTGMAQYASVETWYIAASLIAPLGYVIQDVVADAMTIEAVPTADLEGQPLDALVIERGHQTMQTIGRAAVVGGSVAVSLLNVVVFRDVDSLTGATLTEAYIGVYKLAYCIPVVSVVGVILSLFLGRNSASPEPNVVPRPKMDKTDTYIVLGSLAYLVVAVVFGLQSWEYKEELVFAVSFVIVMLLMRTCARSFTAAQRRTFYAIAFAVFVYRAMPGYGAGITWWSIDVLGFDQGFQARLMLIGSCISLSGIALYTKVFAKRSIFSIYRILTVLGFVLTLPTLGMYFGLHQLTSKWTGGVVDQRTIAVVDTAAESPLGQVVMIPSLAWIANSAPAARQATFFAVVSSFTNLALSAAALFTKQLNVLFVVKREVLDPVSGVVTEAADYSQLGSLIIVASLIGLIVPLVAIAISERWVASAQ